MNMKNCRKFMICSSTAVQCGGETKKKCKQEKPMGKKWLDEERRKHRQRSIANYANQVPAKEC